MSDHYDDDGFQPAGGGIWHTLQRVIFIGITLAVITTIICAYLPVMEKQRIALEEEKKLKLLVEQRRLVTNRKERQLNWLKNDPGYFEIIARDRLDVMKEGETIYRLQPIKEPPPAASPAAPGAKPGATPRRLN